LNIILNIVFIPAYGLIGAALATSIANIIYVLFIVYYYKKYSLASYKSIFFTSKNDFIGLFK